MQLTPVQRCSKAMYKQTAKPELVRYLMISCNAGPSVWHHGSDRCSSAHRSAKPAAPASLRRSSPPALSPGESGAAFGGRPRHGDSPGYTYRRPSLDATTSQARAMCYRVSPVIRDDGTGYAYHCRSGEQRRWSIACAGGGEGREAVYIYPVRDERDEKV